MDVGAVEALSRQDRLGFVAEHEPGPAFEFPREKQWHHPLGVGLRGLHEEADGGLDQFVSDAAVTQEVAADAGFDEVGAQSEECRTGEPFLRPEYQDLVTGESIAMRHHGSIALLRVEVVGVSDLTRPRGPHDENPWPGCKRFACRSESGA